MIILYKQVHALFIKTNVQIYAVIDLDDTIIGLGSTNDGPRTNFIRLVDKKKKSKYITHFSIVIYSIVLFLFIGLPTFAILMVREQFYDS